MAASEQLLDRFKEDISAISDSLSGVVDRLDSHQIRLIQICMKVAQHDTRFDEVVLHLEQHDDNFKKIDGEFRDVKGTLNQILTLIKNDK
jgi:hypothetical protein